MSNKKIISLVLVSSIVFSNSIPTFAKSITIDSNNYMSDTQEGDKNVFYIGENKLVSWEEGNFVYVKQYDSEGNLISSCKGDKTSKEITEIQNNTINTFDANDIIEITSVKEIPATYSYKKVATLKVFNRLNFDTQTMYLYENPGSGIHTTYTIRTYAGTIAAFVAGIVTSLVIPPSVANRLVSSMLAAGLCLLVSDVLKISTAVVLAADKYNLKYYGQDKKTGKKSDVFSNTNKYKIIEQKSNKLNEVYYDSGAYYDPNDNNHTLALTQYLVPNLYGLDYEWYFQ